MEATAGHSWGTHGWVDTRPVSALVSTAVLLIASSISCTHVSQMQLISYYTAIPSDLCNRSTHSPRLPKKDSSMALSTISLLHSISRKGMIVVSSIHQPRSNIFSEFDKVLLLKKGKTVYYGARASMVKYFHNLGKITFAASFFVSSLERCAEERAGRGDHSMLVVCRYILGQKSLFFSKDLKFMVACPSHDVHIASMESELIFFILSCSYEK